jgi:hypothetical protein
VTYTPPAEAAAADVAPEADARPARRTRTPRAEAATDTAQALPGFLTRSSAPAAPAPAAEDVVAPKRRAARKKPEVAADGE